jgi:hypothetical protein
MSGPNEYDQIAAEFPPAVVQRVARPSARRAVWRSRSWLAAVLLGFLMAAGLTIYADREHRARVSDVVSEYSAGLTDCTTLPAPDIATGLACYQALDAKFGWDRNDGPTSGGLIASADRPFVPYEWSAAAAAAWVATLAALAAWRRSIRAQRDMAAHYGAALQSAATQIDEERRAAALAAQQRQAAADEARIQQMMEEIARRRGTTP